MQRGIVGGREGHQSHPDPALKSDSKIPNCVPWRCYAGSLSLGFLLCEMGVVAPTPASRCVLIGVREKVLEGPRAHTLAWPHAARGHCNNFPESPRIRTQGMAHSPY